MTIVIHCAWRVDCNHSLESFEAQIRGMKNFLEFSAQSANKATVVFVSSVSTGWLAKHPGQNVPEKIIKDFNAPEALGYSESKYVCGQLVDSFSKSTGIITAVLRVGQIAGPLSVKGHWNKQEWFPTILASSKYLKKLPQTFGDVEIVDWIPVDRLATIISELLEPLTRTNDANKGQSLVYNLVNPKVTTWSSLLPSVQKLAAIPCVVPLKDWVQALESPQAAKLNAVSRDWIQLWLDQWKS